MTTNEAKPYTDEELEGLRAAGTGVYVGAGVYFGAVDQHALRRLIATLDERDRKLAEAMPPRALREWREALGEHAPEDTGGWSPLVGATHAVVRELAERTRERDEARVTIAEACDLVGDGGDGTLFGRCESLLLEAAALRERLSVVERERDAEAKAALNHAECAERSLRSACDARDALDSVAAVLGVDTTTDADTEARACVAEVAALREEVARLRAGLDAAERRLYDAEAWAETLDDVESVAVRALERYAVTYRDDPVASQALSTMIRLREEHGRMLVLRLLGEVGP